MRKLLAGLVAVLSLSLFTAQISVAAVSPGAKCSKAGATSTYNGKKYTCVKSGKKLVWNKGVALEKPTPVATPSATPTPTPSDTPTPTPSATPTPTPSATPTPTPSATPTFPREFEICNDGDPWVIGITQKGSFAYLSCGPDKKRHPENSEYKIDQKTGEPIGGSPSAVNGQTSSPSNFSNPLCAADPNVPEEWRAYEAFALKTFSCARPYRYVQVKLTEDNPTSLLTNTSQLSPLSECKISNGVRNNSGLIAFPGNPEVDLSRPLNIQIVPVEFLDYPASGTPLADHEKYFRYIKEGFSKLSDGHVVINFNIPSTYVKMGKTLESYATGGTNGGYASTSAFTWKNMDTLSYGRDLIAKVDPVIDFSQTNYIMIMVPPTVPSQYVSHPQILPLFVTNEKTIGNVYSVPPMSAIDRNSWFGVEPFLHLHEMMHPMNLVDDHYGDGEFGRKNGNAGTGNWGIMSGMTTDFLLWDKWISRMIPDSQFRCAPKNVTSTHWLRPSSIYGDYEKGLVIPISNTKVVVIESTRAAGFNFKLPSEAQGALVYVVDASNKNHGEGINVIRPQSRKGTIYETSFVFSDAPLKLNESLVVEGYRISVIESGDFGDVIKVEKA